MHQAHRNQGQDINQANIIQSNKELNEEKSLASQRENPSFSLIKLRNLWVLLLEIPEMYVTEAGGPRGKNSSCARCGGWDVARHVLGDDGPSHTGSLFAWDFWRLIMKDTKSIRKPRTMSLTWKEILVTRRQSNWDLPFGHSLLFFWSESLGKYEDYKDL